MAKQSSPIVPPDFALDLGFTSVPAHVIRDLAPMFDDDGTTAKATGNAMILTDDAIKFRLLDANGRPIEYQVTTSAKRLTPITPEEAVRMKLAKELADAAKLKREDKAATERQRMLDRRADEVRETERAAATKQSAGFADGLKSAVSILPLLKELSNATE